MDTWNENRKNWNFHVLMDRTETMRSNSTRCVYRDDIEIIYKKLEKFCFKALSQREFDFIVLISAIDFVDRSANRRIIKSGWARNINLDVPVYDLEFWSSPAVADTLKTALEFLTGDFWNIEFSLNRTAFVPLSRPELQLRQNVTHQIIPFSDGLDSFAFGQRLLFENENVVQIRLTAKSQGVHDNHNKNFDKRVIELGVPVNSKGIEHGENSFRSRSFKFLGLAALAARMVDAEVVLLPENGQGIHGPVIMPKGHEYFYYGSHPAFTQKFSNFLQLVFGKKIRFEHPNLWVTKGQTLRDLQRVGRITGWDKTRSCVRDNRYTNYDGAYIQCGICINCMLRRVAIMSGGSNFGEEKYLWNNLAADSVAGSMLSNTKRESNSNDIKIGNCAVIGMGELAGFSDSLGADESIMRSAYILEESGIGTIQENIDNIGKIIEAHKGEWAEFLEVLPASSWVRATAELAR